MRLKSITLEGFKSFPDRTRLDFGPGVSVVVGPTARQVEHHRRGALGDGRAVAARRARAVDAGRDLRRLARRRAARCGEVEIVIDNADGEIDVPFSEISINRRLERSGRVAPPQRRPLPTDRRDRESCPTPAWQGD